MAGLAHKLKSLPFSLITRVFRKCDGFMTKLACPRTLGSASRTAEHTPCPACATRVMDPHETTMMKAVKEPDPQKHATKLIAKYGDLKAIARVLEIGGSISANFSNCIPWATYYNLDIENSQSIPTIVGDITKALDIESNSFDLIYSNNTLEHIKEPWLAAEQICRILKPGGYCYVSTVWSWRYHPVPVDYYRFSPDCLEFLFRSVEKLEANFNSASRRRDIRGFWPNRHDSVPVDWLGGWRENWVVYFFGRKPANRCG